MIARFMRKVYRVVHGLHRLLGRLLFFIVHGPTSAQNNIGKRTSGFTGYLRSPSQPGRLYKSKKPFSSPGCLRAERVPTARGITPGRQTAAAQSAEQWPSKTTERLGVVISPGLRSGEHHASFLSPQKTILFSQIRPFADDGKLSPSPAPATFRREPGRRSSTLRRKYP